MNGLKRALAMLLTAALLLPVCGFSESDMEEIPEGWEGMDLLEEYDALSIWIQEMEGTVHLFDSEDNPLELEEDMRMESGTVLETEEESLAVVTLDWERLAIMDETSRAGFDKTDHGDRISITLLNGLMYFRVGQPLEEEERFEVVMDDIILAIRGTCGIVMKEEEGPPSVVLASGHAVVSALAEGDEEPAEIEIAAGESISVVMDELGGGIEFRKKKLSEEEVPAFLVEALRKDTFQLEKVYAETGWQPEKLFGDEVPMWMPPAQELDVIPMEWIGKTIGCGGWYHIMNYFRFTSATEIIDGRWETPMRITSVRQYSPHFYEISYERNGDAAERVIILPGATEEEIQLLKKCGKTARIMDWWDASKSETAWLVSVEYTGLFHESYADEYFYDITASGILQARPFVDYRPSGSSICGVDLEKAGQIAEFPDALVGRTRADYVYGQVLSQYEFMSKGTVRYTSWIVWNNGWREQDREFTWNHISVISLSDHFYCLFSDEHDAEDGFLYMMVMIPGMSVEELQFCREYLIGHGPGAPGAAKIDGNHFYELVHEGDVTEF